MQHNAAGNRQGNPVWQRPQRAVCFFELLTDRDMLRAVLLAFAATDALGGE